MSQTPHAPVSAEELAHAFEDAAPEVSLKPYSVEDWVTQAVFWGMAVCVFLQFFTRYVLNNSLAWTEEIAINGLVVVVFLGSVMCVRQSRHIHVDVLYHYIPPRAGRVLALFVDIVRIGFFLYAAYLFWRYAGIVRRERMVTVDLPRNVVFYAIFAAFALMALRSIQVFVQNLKRGYSVLERPGDFDGIGE
ncbi:ABC transporter permease [Aureimonas sp. Leaf454]|uniref:TRAP transporter small permease n=1 Tax=Aureimonas sp. Leaf454 TaxID=1736381 RepID=UPI0006FADF8A|nr:TRAP transporter small permease [Aureimonas sp. Leaf454]KQT54558.1 ABC transporter permease [Aureimonas sp. Leaf454]